jgi:putative SOS response-associated peptidase YedK
MSQWRAPESEAAILTAAIITKAAEGVAADVHTRMPVIIPKEAESAWLDWNRQDGQDALVLAQEAAETSVEYYVVSSRVNNSRSTGAELIEPFENPA